MIVDNLENEPKINSGFIVPDNYFDNLSDEMMLRIPENKTRIIPVFAKVKTWIYAVAALFAISISIVVINKFANKEPNLDQVLVENYLTESSNFNENDFADLLTANDIKKMEIDLKVDNTLIENELSANENLEEYLTN